MIDWFFVSHSFYLPLLDLTLHVFCLFPSRVLSTGQLRTHGYENNVADIDVQSIDVDFYDNLVTFRVFGYPGPRTMNLSSNEVIFDEGVHLSHETASKNSSYDIKIMFLNQSLLKRYNVFNVTVNNGYYTSIFTLQCTGKVSRRTS